MKKEVKKEKKNKGKNVGKAKRATPWFMAPFGSLTSRYR